VRKKDFWSGSTISLVGLFFLVNSIQMPWRDVGFFWYGAPGLVPAILAGFLMMTGLILLMRAWKKGQFYQSENVSQSPKPKVAAEIKTAANLNKFQKLLETERNRIIAVLLISAIYIFILLGRIPYIAATAIFISGFILIFRGAGWLKSVLIALTTSLAVWLVFVKIFTVVLPG
jgi:hypothetical protein